tara:strand:+ start:270808 stop:271227 length:420 start_codon:yes stop_codon:yes gene_type:complete
MKAKRGVFLVLLLIVLVIVFGIHLLILSLLGLPLFSDRIVLSYVINYVLAGIILWVVQSNLNKQSAHTGFIFMAGSGIKFLLFFIFFYPYYQNDEVMQTTEFAAFFTPYAVCLVLEVIYLSKLLNNQSYPKDNPSEKKK